MQLHPEQKVGQLAQQEEPLQEGPSRNWCCHCQGQKVQEFKRLPRDHWGEAGSGAVEPDRGGTETCFGLNHRRGTILLYFQSVQDPLLSRPFLPKSHISAACTLRHSSAHFPHLALTITVGTPVCPLPHLFGAAACTLHLTSSLRSAIPVTRLASLSQDGSQQLLPE